MDVIFREVGENQTTSFSFTNNAILNVNFKYEWSS